MLWAGSPLLPLLLVEEEALRCTAFTQRERVGSLAAGPVGVPAGGPAPALPARCALGPEGGSSSGKSSVLCCCCPFSIPTPSLPPPPPPCVPPPPPNPPIPCAIPLAKACTTPSSCKKGQGSLRHCPLNQNLHKALLKSWLNRQSARRQSPERKYRHTRPGPTGPVPEARVLLLVDEVGV